jgi:transposase InsO family protein
MAESFFATLKKGHLFWQRFRTREEARRKSTTRLVELFEYLEVFYNRIRRHSALRYKSPVAFELQSARWLNSLREIRGKLHSPFKL